MLPCYPHIRNRCKDLVKVNGFAAHLVADSETLFGSSSLGWGYFWDGRRLDA